MSAPVREAGLPDDAARAAAPPVEPEHALHFDPSCEECAYLARPVVIRLPSPDRPAGLRTNFARDELIAWNQRMLHGQEPDFTMLIDRAIREGAALLASEGLDGLDVERLARALHAFYAGKDTRDEFFPPDCTHQDDARIIAVAYAADDPNAAIAAEYARLSDREAGA